MASGNRGDGPTSPMPPGVRHDLSHPRGSFSFRPNRFSLELEAPGGKPALMTGVLVTREGGGYKIQYSLQDKDLAYTSSDGTLTVWFVDHDEEATRYFQKYQTLLGGEVWGHLIILSGSEVSQYGSDIFATMKLRFETAKGAVFEDEDTFFL